MMGIISSFSYVYTGGGCGYGYGFILDLERTQITVTHKYIVPDMILCKILDK